MAEAITVACPECETKLTVPAAAAGKKVRCKGCEHVFVVKAPAAKKGAPAKPAGRPKPPDAKAAAAKPAKPAADDEDEDGNPYGVTALDKAYRCPECANEMESEDAIICLHCGYNTQTRYRVEARSIEDVTGWTWFLWLLPGIACALGFLFLLTLDIWYTFKIGVFVDAENDWYAFVTYPWFKIWIIWAPSVLMDVGLLTFAVRRLILHPRPPERLKKKQRKDVDV